jgi:SAM-dependent methyltransferase
MGIVPTHLHLFALEHPTRPLRGDVLILGQQFVYATLAEVRDILRGHGATISELPAGFDTAPKIPDAPAQFTNAQTVATLLGAKSVRVADVSSYENPDYLIDLNYDVDATYVERFDAILDVGTLEHVFDVPTALNNMVRMLRPGGLVALGYPASNCIDHGFYSFSPTLFYDYFAANGFDDFSCYLVEGSSHNQYKKSRLYRYKGYERQFPLVSRHPVEVFFFATKRRTGELRKPSQSFYREVWGNAAKPEPKQAVRVGKASPIRRLLRHANRITRRTRPELIDALLSARQTRVNKRDNLEYLGRF